LEVERANKTSTLLGSTEREPSDPGRTGGTRFRTQGAKAPTSGVGGHFASDDTRFFGAHPDRQIDSRMAKQDDKLELDASVVEALPNAMFKVRLPNDVEVLAYVSGKMRQHYIRILPGDRVRVELSPYDLTKARITYRH